VKTERKTVCDY